MSKNKQPMVHVNLRLPEEVLEYYKQKYPTYTKGMRDILITEYEDKRPTPSRKYSLEVLNKEIED